MQKLTVASTCRSMILAGKTDEQIWSALRRVFKIDESKRRYVSWYRAEVRRRGLTKNRRSKKQEVDRDRRHSKYNY